ncbi:hypothetical protein GM182_02720 [bacterium 3DAC]|jgi:predicted regulator of Ras-like GTPase activity (Roadblock/LC7/MglB family)|nr:hypothetical protein [Dictyoglomota bacterium]UZN22838.1 hypothetical protein GM182_02720 [bacterium 3DAC]
MLPDNVKSEIAEILKRIELTSTGIRATIVSTVDGFHLVSTVPDTELQERLAAMVSSLFAISEQIGEGVLAGDFEYSATYSSEEILVTRKVNDKVLISVITSKRSNTSLLVTILTRYASQIADIIGDLL